MLLVAPIAMAGIGSAILSALSVMLLIIICLL